MSTVTGQQQDEYVLVPRKPTKAMLEAAWADALAENAEGVWRSMIENFEGYASSGKSASGNG